MNKIRTVLIIPVGVTHETVQGILRAVSDSITGVVAVSTKGFKDVKKGILDGIRTACELIGARYIYIEVDYGDPDASAKIYMALRKLGAERLVVSGVTGSRFLVPIIAQAVLRYWHDTGSEVLLIHGVEGEKWWLQPLIGFFIYDLDRAQKRVFKIIYEHGDDVLRTKGDIILKYRFSRAVYKVLKKLEEKGLIKRRRNRIEKTYPGLLLYNLLKEAGEI